MAPAAAPVFSGVVIHRLLPILAAAAAFALTGAAPALAATHSFTGTAAGCSYSVSIDTAQHTVSAELSSCTALDLHGTVSGNYTTTDVNLTKLSNVGGTVAGQSESIGDRDIDADLSVGVNFDDFATQAQAAQDAAADVATKAQSFAASQVAQGVLSYGTGIDFDKPWTALEGAEQNVCAAFDGSHAEHTNDMCDPLDCAGGGCNTVTSRTAGVAADSQPDQDTLCPAIDHAQDDLLFVCLPTYLPANLDAGDKALVLLPGAALLTLPGEGGLDEQHTVSSDVAIVSMGGVVAGLNVKLRAPEVAFASGIIGMLRKLEIDASDSLSIGSVSVDELASAVGHPIDLSNEDLLDLSGFSGGAASNLGALGENYLEDVPSELPSSGSVSLPVRAFAGQVKIDARRVAIGSTSRIDTLGLGGLPQLFDGTQRSGGEQDSFGGSHGGYGGIPLSSFTQDQASSGDDSYPLWHTPAGRAQTFDDPFDPSQPGDGGGADPNNQSGVPGGGTVAIDAHGGDVRVDGTVSVTGYDTGSPDGKFILHGGGAGAGGSVTVKAKRLLGSGLIDADGGNNCSDCANGFGGGGAGGRVAVLSGDSSGFSGTIRAHGGLDEQFPGLQSDQQNEADGTGGAGTVFDRTVTFADDGTVAGGTGAFPGGTVTIDGGRPAGAYPPPDGTPIDDSWGANDRRLVLKGEARGYGSRPSFGEVDVLGGSTLTTDPADTTLDLTAGTLHVDSASRVSVDTRGYAGGEGHFQPGGTAPGEQGSSPSWGGSHGGAGGGQVLEGSAPDPSARAGSTYDSTAAPALPGAGGGSADSVDGNAGGGVLDVHASKLELDGALSADGQDGGGPTATDPTAFDREDGGGGAGGSVVVTAGDISGAGLVSARGGSVCLDAPPLLPGSAPCNDTAGNAGGGGGGRIAMHVDRQCGWTGHAAAPGGTDLGATGDDIAISTGAAGSVVFPAPANGCPAGGDDGTQPPAAGEPAPPALPAPVIPAPAPPSRAPTVKVSGAASQRAAGALEVSVACPDSDCDASATGTIALPGAARVHRIKSLEVHIRKGRRAILRLKLTRGLSKRIVRAIRHHHRVHAAVSATIRLTGHPTVRRTMRIRLHR